MRTAPACTLTSSTGTSSGAPLACAAAATAGLARAVGAPHAFAGPQQLPLLQLLAPACFPCGCAAAVAEGCAERPRLPAAAAAPASPLLLLLLHVPPAGQQLLLVAVEAGSGAGAQQEGVGATQGAGLDSRRAVSGCCSSTPDIADLALWMHRSCRHERRVHMAHVVMREAGPARCPCPCAAQN